MKNLCVHQSYFFIHSWCEFRDFMMYWYRELLYFILIPLTRELNVLLMIFKYTSRRRIDNETQITPWATYMYINQLGFIIKFHWRKRGNVCGKLLWYWENRMRVQLMSFLFLNKMCSSKTSDYEYPFIGAKETKNMHDSQ